MNEIIFRVEEAPEGGYTAHALRLGNQVRDAVRCHFDEGTGPKVIRLHFVREAVLAA